MKKTDIAVGQIPRHHDEVSTTNRNLLSTYSHTFSSDWGLSITAPVMSRKHFHIHHHHGAARPESWDYSELGDVSMLSRYQFPYLGDPLKPSAAGIIFGLKLPTGKTDIVNENGDMAERRLQPGTGTTDAIIGAYYHQRLPQWNASWFAQMQYQQALNSHEKFKPGEELGLDVGYRHGLTDKPGALVQMNLLVKGRHSGRQAEPQDSGGKFVFVSPGLSYSFTEAVQIYGFFQKPLYQNVNGVQLTADEAFVVGVTSRF